MTTRTIYMNTKSNQSIALFPCTSKSYIKEYYEERDAGGELRNSKRITLPLIRDGKNFETVDALFEHLCTFEGYQRLRV